MTAVEHTELVRAACERLAVEGYFAWPNRTGAATIDGRFVAFGKKGSGDIIALLDGGTHAEFEAKTGTATQSKDQKIHQRKVEDKGGVYIVFHSVAELMERLRTAESRRRTATSHTRP